MTEYILVFKSLNSLEYQTTNTNEIESIQTLNNKWLGLSKSGDLFELPQSPEASPIQLSLKIQIQSIASNSLSSLLLSTEGQVFSLGSDPLRTGILGHTNEESSGPYLIPELRNIEQVSIGRTHAGALSISSAFYLWGKCPGVSSATPTRQSFDLFTIQRFECGEDYSLITTTGGYLYIVGSLGFTHSAPCRPGPVGVFAPPNIEKMCVTSSSAGFKLVAFINDCHEAFVFDGCLEIVKLPMQSSSRIESVKVVDMKVLGTCENGKIIEWVLDSGKDEKDCNLYSFTGFSYAKNGGFQVIGHGNSLCFALSEKPKPILEKAETILPYKRTEFGKKLILKAKESVRASGKLDFMRSSVENSPVFKPPKNNDLPRCEKMVYCINFVFKKFFSEIKVFAYQQKSRATFKNRGIFGMFYKNYQKFKHQLTAKAFEKLKINVEFRIFREKCMKSGIRVLEEIITRVFLYTGLEALVFEKKQQVLAKVLATLQARTLKKENLFFRVLKVDLRLWNLKKVLSPKVRLAFGQGFFQVKKDFKDRKSCLALVNSLKKKVHECLHTTFNSIKSYSWLVEMNKSVYQLHKDTSINTLFFLLNSWKTSQLKQCFRLLKHLTFIAKLGKVLCGQMYLTLDSLVPRLVSPVLISLQSSFLSMELRGKKEAIREILHSSFLENSIEHEIDMLSPIKIFNAKEDDSQIKCSTLSFPVGGNLSHQRNNSSELSDFQKYLLWYREFKCKPKSKQQKKPKQSEKPPWRPSGIAIKKTRNDDEETKKNVERRRDYSESIRSSKSSFSSEESFCRKIGWDKEGYLLKFRARKARELLKMVAMSGWKWIFYRVLRKVWKLMKVYAEARKVAELVTIMS